MKIIKNESQLHISDKNFQSKSFVFSRIQKYVFFAICSFLALAPLASTNADFNSQNRIQSSAFTASCWSVPSVPVHMSPSNGFVANYGSAWLNNPLFDWQNSSSACPNSTISYDFEVSMDPFFSPNSIIQSGNSLNTSQFLSSLNLDGTYYWHVRAKDQFGHTSNFSQPWSLVISRTTLEVPQMKGWNLKTNSLTPGEIPLDLVCGDTTNGGNPDLAFVSHYWTPVPGSNVKYHVEITFPNGAKGNAYYAGPSYTQFWYLGSFPGIQGLWKVRVRAFIDVNNDNILNNGEVFSNWSNQCNLTLDKNAPAVPPIVLNEIYPSPSTPDTASKPDGEWVELYNRSSSAIDVNGWVLYDADNGHALPISSGNSDNNNNPFDGGETVVPANGYLVVYRNGDSDFDLDNNGDTVRLFNAPIGSGVLKDSHTFGATAVGKSIARIGDGANNWIDPIGTPDRKNAEHQSDLQPSINVYQQNQHHLQVGVFDATNYQTAHLTVTYMRDQDGQPVQEQFTKNLTITKTSEFMRDLFMGTISSGTEYPHYGIHQVHVQVVFTGSGIPDRTLSTDLASWSETP